MMQRAGFVLVLMLAVLMAAGCVSTKDFETTIADVTSRVDDVQGGVEENSEKTGQLEKMDAELAGKVEKVGADVGKAQQTSEQAVARALAAE